MILKSQKNMNDCNLEVYTDPSPNLKNLSCGLNLSRGLNMVGSNVSRFKPALNLNRVLADLNHGSNSLNFISDDPENRSG